MDKKDGKKPEKKGENTGTRMPMQTEQKGDHKH